MSRAPNVGTGRLLGFFGRDASLHADPAGAGHAFGRAGSRLGTVQVGDGVGVESTFESDGSFCIVLGTTFDGGGASGPANRVLDAVRSRGPAGTGEVDGEYSAVVWDAEAETLWLIRDRNGVQPLFYAELDGVLLWSDDLAGLLGAGVPAVVDPNALDVYLSCGYVFAPWTMFAGIRKVEPAHALHVTEAGRRSTRYWTPTWGSDPDPARSERVEAIGRAFEAAVGHRLARRGSTGVLLSGGIDSSLIVAAARAVHDAPVEAFTFRYRGHDGPMNEGSQARELAEHFGAGHTEIEISAEWIGDNMADLLLMYEEPFSYGLHSSRLGPIREAGIEVLLSGVCTDGWYLSDAEALAFRAARLGRIPMTALGAASRAGAGRLSMARRAATLHRLATAPESAVFYDAAANSILSDAERASLYERSEAAGDGRRAALDLLDESLVHVPDLNRADRYTYLAWQFDWPEHLLWWNHRWAAAAGLAMGYPYVDRDLADLLAASPRPTPPKVDFREYGATLMPSSLASRPKYPQAVPLNEWLRGPLEELVRTYLDPAAIRDDGFFDADAVSAVVDAHMSGAGRHKWPLWTLTSYFVWKEAFGVAGRI